MSRHRSSTESGSARCRRRDLPGLDHGLSRCIPRRIPIGEWWPHLYRLKFYEYDGWTAGLDASILQSGPREDWGDFTFHNTTNGYLLIEAYVDGQTDVVKIYGPETGWDVYVSDP